MDSVDCKIRSSYGGDGGDRTLEGSCPETEFPVLNVLHSGCGLGGDCHVEVHLLDEPGIQALKLFIRVDDVHL